ncbi:hypothetical protein [Catenovulum agarivorans]|uniref:hypothetical protein n=1 Tax=Catenovulum agarivorans TaxID=1172192 RepID=UPI000301719A|nr:hypothetical protein [Catenovulum agarivorans]
MNKRYFVIFTMAILLQACANTSAPKHVPLTNNDSIKNLVIYNFVAQDQIYPDVELERIDHTYAVMNGGALGYAVSAIVESSINANKKDAAAGAMQQLYRYVGEYDFRKEHQKLLMTTISRKYSVSVEGTEATKIPLTNQALSQRISELKEGEALLLLSSEYRFVNRAKSLTLVTEARIYTKNAKTLDKQPQPSYYNQFYYESLSTGSGRDDSLRRWADDDAKLFIETLNHAVVETIDLMLFDLHDPLENKCAADVASTFKTPENIYTQLIGKFISEKNGRYVYRENKSGRLISTVNKHHPVTYKKGKAPSKNSCYLVKQ